MTAWRPLANGDLARGTALLSPVRDLLTAEQPGGWNVEVAGEWVDACDHLEAAQALAAKTLVDDIAVEGGRPLLCDRADIAAHPFMLSILTADGAIDSVDEVEPGYPTWFSAPRFAKAAGAALIGRHAELVGYEVTKVDRGHWRTVASYIRDELRS